VNYRRCREPDKRDGVGWNGTRSDASFDLKAVRTGLGAALRTLHSNVLREEVPDRMGELLRQLDQQKGHRQSVASVSRAVAHSEIGRPVVALGAPLAFFGVDITGIYLTSPLTRLHVAAHGCRGSRGHANRSLQRTWRV
jgi:Anti-sigma factor NepR